MRPIFRGGGDTEVVRAGYRSWIQKVFVLRQSRALETLSHGVTRQRRSLSPVYNAVTSPTLYKAEAEVSRNHSRQNSTGGGGGYNGDYHHRVTNRMRPIFRGGGGDTEVVRAGYRSWIQKVFVLRQSRALETLSHGVTRQHRSLSPVYNAVTSHTLYKAEAEVSRNHSRQNSTGGGGGAITATITTE